MPQLTIEIQDSLYNWLQSEASDRRTTVEDLMNSLIRDRSASVSRQERLLLGLFHNVSTKPGRTISAKLLWISWGVRGTREEFEAALLGLLTKGFLTSDPDGTQFTLTAAGFARGH